MRSTLVDAGPLIALFDKNDAYHQRAMDFMKAHGGRLLTTWCVITEVSHMLDFSVKTQINFLTWIHRGGLEIFELQYEQILRMIELTEKYKDVPMDLADATLIVASESKNVHEIATIDSDLYVYRNIRKKYLKNIFI
jgi:predicted nucleic acid-binding protein